MADGMTARESRPCGTRIHVEGHAMVFQPNYGFKKMQREKAKRSRKERKAQPAEAGMGPAEPDDSTHAETGIPDDQAAQATESAP